MLPVLNQFNMSIDKIQASLFLRILKNYQSEIGAGKKMHLMEMAKQKKEGKKVQPMKRTVIKNGLNHMTIIIENKPTELVIPHDVESVEM
eukprot:13955385-Heterocapsa_arctica.AAC.1